MKTLLIMLSSGADRQVWHWAYGDFQNSETNIETGTATNETEKSNIAAFALEKACGGVWALLPGAEVISRINTLSGLSAKQQKLAIGFDIEDDLAAPLAQTHIAISRDSARIAIADKDAVRSALSALAEYGMHPNIVCADYEVLPPQTGLNVLGRIICRRADGTGFSAEPELVQSAALISGLMPAPASILQFWQAAAQVMRDDIGVLNLRQQAFAKPDDSGRKHYVRIAALAAAVFIAFAGLQISQGLQYKNKAEQARAEIAALYTSKFPDQALPPNPALALVRAGQSGPVGDDRFLRLSAILASSVKQVEGVTVSTVRFDRTRGELNVSLLYGDFADAEKLRDAVKNAGAAFEEAGTRQGADGVTGDIILRGAT